MEREALKLALEALEEAWYHVGTFQPTDKAIDLYDEARAAIKEALAQPAQEQEPVAHVYSFDHDGRPLIAWDNAKGIKIGDKLYTPPLQGDT